MEWVFITIIAYITAWYASGYLILRVLMNQFLKKNDCHPFGDSDDHRVNALGAMAGPLVVIPWWLSRAMD